MIKAAALSLALISCLSATAVRADNDVGPSFAIKDYRFSGNTLLPQAQVEALLEKFTNQAGNFDTIQEAVSALEASYVLAGFGAVKVVLPEQDIEDGIIQLKIIEGQLGTIRVEGQKHFSEENIRASLPGLREKQQPNMRDIDASLRVANENSAKQTNLIFRQGAVLGEVDALIRVADENPMRLAFSMDNTGVPGSDGEYSTGRYRTGFILQHSNLFDLDHALSFQYLTSPDHVDKVSIIGAGYRVPLYDLGDVLEFAFGYSNVDSGKITTAAGPIGISGSGQVYVFKYEQFLPKLGDWQQKLTYGLDYRIYTNSVKADSSNQSLVPDTTVHPISLSYTGNIRRDGGDFSSTLSYLHNIPGGADGTTEDFNRPGGRMGSTANYQVWRYNLSATQALFAGSFVKATFSGQYTRDALISGEQFGVGGLDSVRGFYERELSNDRGYRGGLELYSPELGSWSGQSDLRLRLLAFYEGAHLQRNKPLPGEQVNQNIASVGLGLRAGYGKYANFRLDWGVVTNAGASHQVGDHRLHGSFIGFF